MTAVTVTNYGQYVNVGPEGNTILVQPYVCDRVTYWQKDKAVKRLKPVDLFAAGTPRMYDYYADYHDPLLLVANDKSIGESYRSANWVYGIGLISNLDPPDISTQLRLKIKDAGANLYQNLGEYRDTVGLLRKACEFTLLVAKSLRNPGRLLNDKHFRARKEAYTKQYKSFRKKPKHVQRQMSEEARRRFQRRLIEDAADAQLQWNFGIAPLLDDLKDARDRLKGRIGDSGYITTTTGCSRTVWDEQMRYGTFNSRFGIPSLQIIRRVKVQARARVKYRVDSALLKEFGLTNPFSAAYELIPFSLVVDQLLNIGNTLSALDALHGVQEVVWYSTTRIEQDAVQSLGGYATYHQLVRSGISTEVPFGHIEYAPTRSMKALANDLALMVGLRKR